MNKYQDAIREGLLSHVQTVGKGGLLITLAKLMRIRFRIKIFNRYNKCTIVVRRKADMLFLLNQVKLKYDNAIEIGLLTDSDNFKVTTPYTEISENVSDIKQMWEGAIAQCLTTQD